MRVDLHVHSRFSERPAHWLMKRLGCNESYTEPREVYRLARSKGMSLVTLTDHNTIDGCRELADLPDTFISEEVTTYFPEDGCKIHVLAYDITESQHREIQEVRDNVFDLVSYLRSRGIVHALAHPFLPVNDGLSLEHVEKLLLLFQVLEVNGDQPEEENDFLRELAQGLTPALIERWADKHGLAPTHPNPWRKGLVGGSDDHSSLYVARAFTQVAGAVGRREFLAGVRDGRASAHFDRAACTPQAVAHGIYSVAYQFCKRKVGRGRSARGDVLTEVLDWLLEGRAGDPLSGWSRLRWAWNAWVRPRPRTAGPAFGMEGLRKELLGLLAEERGLPGQVKALHRSAGAQGAWFHVVDRVASRALRRLGDHLLDHLVGGDGVNLFQSLGAAGALSAALAPYFFAFSGQASQRDFLARARPRLLPEEPSAMDTVRVLHFVEDPDHAGRVALALRSEGCDGLGGGQGPAVLTCHGDQPGPEGVKAFAPVGAYELPEYPGGRLCYPPFLEMLDYCHSYGPTHVHTLTPGPLGLAAIGIARILRLPLIATVDPDWLQQAVLLAERRGAEGLLWNYLAWFCNQTGAALVPSASVRDRLVEGGVARRKLPPAPSGFDPAWVLRVAAGLAPQDETEAAGSSPFHSLIPGETHERPAARVAPCQA